MLSAVHKQPHQAVGSVSSPNALSALESDFADLAEQIVKKLCRRKNFFARRAGAGVSRHISTAPNNTTSLSLRAKKNLLSPGVYPERSLAAIRAKQVDAEKQAAKSADPCQEKAKRTGIPLNGFPSQPTPDINLIYPAKDGAVDAHFLLRSDIAEISGLAKNKQAREFRQRNGMSGIFRPRNYIPWKKRFRNTNC